MKLSPPASSSDLEAARDVARRLHQRRRRADRPADEAPRAHAHGLAARAAPAAGPPAPPSWDKPAPSLDDPLAEFSQLASEEPTDVAPLPRVAAEERGVSPEEMVGIAEPPPFEDVPAPATLEVTSSPFDVGLDDTVDEALGTVEAPPPPSWDEIVEACLGHAHARGAMLIDPAGQVFAARGEWPHPGPEAIAAKLVATMNRTLRDAPTRSISAPLMGRHLTAWRVPLAEGLVTAAFLGDAPVRAEARPVVDTEIHRGAGA